MTWTYGLSDLATSPKDQVRLTIGDTVSTDPQLQDEEIGFFVTLRSSIDGAAAECCRTLATQYSRSADTAGGDQKVSYSQLAKAYALRALQFDAQAAMAGAGLPYAGGISVTDKQLNENDPDRVSPEFSRGMFDSNLPLGQLAVEAPDSGDNEESSS